MKMTFKLSDKQLDRAKQLIAESNAAYRAALDEFPMEQWGTTSGFLITGYHDDIKNHYYVWLGDLGFLKVTNKHTVPNLHA